MPTRYRLFSTALFWTFVVGYLGHAAGNYRAEDNDAIAAVFEALAIMAAFPSGLGWYYLTIGGYKKEE